MKIGIDPGHGGFDPGAIGPTGLYEKDVTLGISLELAKILREKVDVMLTRETDVAISGTRNATRELQAKTNRLNTAGCDLAVSIHINSSLNREACYISTFIQGVGGEAERLAKEVQSQLVQVTGWPDGDVREKNLHMTRETKMPAILVECGFISSPAQEAQLRQPETQKKLARAIAAGILDYLGLEGKPMADKWKKDLMSDLMAARLVNDYSDPDEPAPKWWIAAVVLNLYSRMFEELKKREGK